MGSDWDNLAPWLGLTPTGQQLEEMDLPFFHHAIDQLEAESVPRRYWEKVVAKRLNDSWDVR